jgi:hypothetical protein
MNENIQIEIFELVIMDNDRNIIREMDQKISFGFID